MVIKFIVNKNKSDMKRKTSGKKMRGNLVKTESKQKMECIIIRILSTMLHNNN